MVPLDPFNLGDPRMTFATADQALDALEIVRRDYLLKARAVAVQLGLKGAAVTVDDIREHCPPPPGIDGRVMGAVFRKAEDWQHVGYTRSKRETCHKRPISQFVYVGPIVGPLTPPPAAFDEDGQANLFPEAAE